MAKFNLIDALLIILGTVLILNNNEIIGVIMIFLVVMDKY